MGIQLYEILMWIFLPIHKRNTYPIIMVEKNSASLVELDRQTTLRNREKLHQNTNLLYWYESLYRHQFAAVPDISDKRVLEIGSGTSPLKRFYPNVITSDLLKLDYLDLVFDCHEIDKLKEIPDGSLDIITLTNVIHHLKDPINFLIKAAVKLKDGGRIIATEPEFSLISKYIYMQIHHEAVDFDLEEPLLSVVEGPLSSANIALPYLIFRTHEAWADRLSATYCAPFDIRFFTSVSYMYTGGISRRIPIPLFIYRAMFAFDAMLAQMMPRLLAGFFTIDMVKRSSD